jgi:hypothetical protein
MNRKTTTPTRRPSWPAGGVLMLLLCCGGCGQSASPSDPAEGRKALQAVLDAWKGGEKPDTLAQRTPPIHVADGDWMSGLRLQGYKADDGGKLVGSDVNYNVVLELKTAQGKVVRRDAVYAVTTHPQLLVLRQDNL